MKILWLPDVYSHQVFTSSCVQAHEALARGVWELDKSFQSYMLLPAPCKYFQYPFPSDTKWLKFLPFVSRIDELGIDVEGDRLTVPDLWSLSESVDVLVTSRLFVNALVEQWCRENGVLSAVWHVDLEAFVRIQKYIDVMSEMTVNRHIFLLTPSEKYLLASLFNGKLSARLRRDKKMTVLPFCVDLNHFPATPPYSNRTVPNMFYGGSTNVKKHIPEIVAVATTLFEANVIERFVVSTFEYIEKFPQTPWCEIRGNVMPADYRVSQREGDVFVCLSDYDACCLAPFEQMLSGQVGVFADRPWIREQIPESYPYIARDENVLGVTAWVCAHLDEARMAIRPALKEMRQRYGHSSVASHFIETIKGWHDAYLATA